MHSLFFLEMLVTHLPYILAVAQDWAACMTADLMGSRLTGIWSSRDLPKHLLQLLDFPDENKRPQDGRKVTQLKATPLVSEGIDTMFSNLYHESNNKTDPMDLPGRYINKIKPAKHFSVFLSLGNHWTPAVPSLPRTQISRSLQNSRSYRSPVSEDGQTLLFFYSLAHQGVQK